MCNACVRTSLPCVKHFSNSVIKFRLCLVAVKRFSENTYFPEMLIFGKGKCFHGVWLHFKKFFQKIFSGVWKRRRKTQIKKCRITQIRKTQATNPGKHKQIKADSFKYFYRKCIKLGKRNQNPAKENESTTSDDRCDERRATSDDRCDERRATSGAIVDRRAVPSSIDERACQTRNSHRSRRSSIDEQCDRPDDCARRSRRSSARCDRWTSGTIWALSLSLSLSLFPEMI